MTAQLARAKWIIIGAVVVAVILALTNPNQAAHLSAVHEAVHLRFRNADPESPAARPPFDFAIECHNYILFSTCTLFDATVSFGFLGQIQTTNEITRTVTGPPQAPQ